MLKGVCAQIAALTSARGGSPRHALGQVARGKRHASHEPGVAVWCPRTAPGGPCATAALVLQRVHCAARAAPPGAHVRVLGRRWSCRRCGPQPYPSLILCSCARPGSQVDLPPLRCRPYLQTLPYFYQAHARAPGSQVELPPLRSAERLRAGDSLLLMPGQAAALAPAPPGAAGHAAPGADGYWAGDAPQYVTLTLLLPTADAAAAPGARPALPGAVDVQASPCLRAVESGGWRLPTLRTL